MRNTTLAVALAALLTLMGCAALRSIVESGAPDVLTGAGEAAVTVAPLLPPPWNLIVGGAWTAAAALATAWAGYRRGRAPARVIVESIEAAKARSPEFAAAMKSVAEIINDVQDDRARRVVESVQESRGNE